MKRFILVLLLILLSFSLALAASGKRGKTDEDANSEVSEEAAPDDDSAVAEVTEVRASHILVVTEKEAKQVKARLDRGEDFAEVAKEVSKCPSAARGGDLGFFGRGAMVPEFEKAAFALEVGEVSGPVKTQFGWHIIMVTDKKSEEQ